MRTRTRTRMLVAAAAAAVLGSCVAAGPGQDRLRPLGDQAEVVVEVYSGLVASGEPQAPQPHLHFLVDVTPLMTSESGPLDPEVQLSLARKLTAPYMQERETQAAPEFHAFHRMARSAKGSCPEAGAGAESFASEAIEKLRGELASREEDARVVLFTSFKNECQPKLCQAAEDLVQKGSWLDTVVIGAETSSAPQCLSQLRPSLRQPEAWLARWTPPAPGFSVSAVTDAESADTSSELATGVAGGSVLVSPGLRTIRVALDPPERVGPIRLRPGDRVRVRIMNFPASAPEGRTWIVEPIDAR